MPQTLTALGPEFQVNTNTGGNNGISGAQVQPDVAMLPDGRFAVTYQSDYFGNASDTESIVALFNADAVTPLIGASGAIAGVLGAYLVLYPRAQVWSLVPFLFFLPLRLPAWLVLGLWFVLQWAYSSGYAVSAAGDVAYLAHVAGFVVGALIAWPLRGRRVPPSYPPPRPRYVRAR